MLGYKAESAGQEGDTEVGGHDDADIRYSVTVVTIMVKNQKVSEDYIAGLRIKFHSKSARHVEISRRGCSLKY